MPAASLRDRLFEVARVFLLLGTTAFGGPAAQVALMAVVTVVTVQLAGGALVGLLTH